MEKEELIKKIMNCCFADDSGNFWEKFKNWEPGQTFYTSSIDPDYRSKRLYEFHKFLWNKQEQRKVDVIWNGYAYELIGIDDKKFRLGSDSIMSIYWHCSDKYEPYATIIKNLSQIENIENTDEYKNLYGKYKGFYLDKDITNYCPLKKFIYLYLQKANTIGGFIVFPRHDVSTVNTVRGKSGKIRDRFDLTLECIRRYYQTRDYNPLFDVLEENKMYFGKDEDFFDIFRKGKSGFENYARFFCLNESWVNNGKVLCLMNKDNKSLDTYDFSQEPLPKSTKQWWTFYRNIMDRLNARNKQIEKLLSDCSEEDMQRLYNDLRLY